MSYLIALHTGAGNCSDETNRQLRRLCRQVCTEVTSLLHSGSSAADAAVAATLLLEASPLTNAGTGSSITSDKKIKTEASLLSTDSGFHSAGDLENLQHPIKLVALMARDTLDTPSDGYVPPRVMVGQDAVDRYSERDPAINQINLSTKHSIKMFYKAHKYFNKSEPQSSSNVRRVDAQSGVEDTVGVICVDSQGKMACAASSGGSVMKHSGRLGQCCVHGAGSYLTPSLGVVTTGNGEQIINKLLAINLAFKLQTVADPTSALDSCFGPGDTKMAGFLSVEKLEEGLVCVHAQHSLTNMVFGLQSSSMRTAESKILTAQSPTFVQMFKM